MVPHHIPRHVFQDPACISKAPIPQVESPIPPQDSGTSRPVSRPSHSIDSIMGNISSGSSQQDQQVSHKSTISSNFMPNFNLHGNGTNVPSISTSFSMNFPSSFKVANDDEEDDYDT